MDKESTKRLQEAFYLGGERTPSQDIRYQFQQLSDVVIRALSPGINDPFTAINGIDELATGLTQLAQRPRVKPLRQDAAGRPRLYVPTAELAQVLDETIGHIVIYASDDRFVMRALREATAAVMPFAVTDEEREVLAALEQSMDRRERKALEEAGLA